MTLKKLVIGCRVSEAAAVVKEIIDNFDTQKELANDSNLDGMVNELRPLLQQLIDVINSHKTSSELASKHAIRAGLIRKISSVIDGYTNVPVEKISSAANVIKTVFDQFGVSIIHESYAVSSILVHSLLQKFEETSIMAYCKALVGLEQLILSLKDAQTDFDLTQADYDDALIMAKECDSASKIKNQLIPLLNTRLVGYMGSMKAFDTDKYGNFANHVEKSITKINDAVKRRGGGSQHEQDIDPIPDE